MMVRFGLGLNLSLEDVVAAADGAQVEVSPETIATLRERRGQICRFLEARGTPAYGFNRGFGHNVDQPVDAADVRRLQQNLIRSHAAGMGEPMPPRIVRATMLLRAHSLAQGHSGVRPEVVETIVRFLNAGITPVVPRFGSVGASGDLAPLSHIALGLMGEGEVTRGDNPAPSPAAGALQSAGIAPLVLEMKEGLALNNGVQFSTACGLLACAKLEDLLITACAATAVSCQVMFGSDTPYAKELHELRRHPGARTVAGWLRALCHHSPIREAHRPYEVDGEIQDPYNLRCAPQILGACQELIAEARTTFEREANSVTDNPLLLRDPSTGEYTLIVSGGHFHGMPVAVKLYNLVQAMATMARLSNMRCVRYVDEARNKGLGSDLIWPGLGARERATSSGMMIPEYVSAALTNVLWGDAMPSHLFSLSTDAGQEDHVSMSAGLAVRVLDMVPRLAEVLAIELAFGAQGAAIRRESASIPSKQISAANPAVQAAAEALRTALGASVPAGFEPELHVTLRCRWGAAERALSPAGERILETVRRYFPVVQMDRELSTPLRALAAAVLEGEVTRSIAPLIAHEA